MDIIYFFFFASPIYPKSIQQFPTRDQKADVTAEDILKERLMKYVVPQKLYFLRDPY